MFFQILVFLLNERLGNIERSNTLIISTFLDPRFKNIGFLKGILQNPQRKLS